MLPSTQLLASRRLITSSESEARMFCSTVITNRHRFEMDYILATLQKPYVAILDGITSR